MEFSYKFPVARGHQASREYYIAMVPLKMLSRLFSGDDEYIPPEYRAQRRINEARIPSIGQYILNNRGSYVFSALSASIDGEFIFEPVSMDSNLGVLDVSLDARFLINDGPHRKAAILKAIGEDESLKEETISIVFFEDSGLECSQQMFTDLNKHAVKTSNSIAELYDSRDELAVITRKVIFQIPFLNRYTDKEKDILGKFSSNLFALNTFYNANKRIIRQSMSSQVAEVFLLDYRNEIVNHILPWKELDSHLISKLDLREKYIITQAVIIQVFGRLGNYFVEHPEADCKGMLAHLEESDWRRTSDTWKLRVIRANGRMINNESAVILTCNAIKQFLGITLDPDETNCEHEVYCNVKNYIMFKQFEEIKKEMRLVYFHDQRPWLIGFSGGKDSTMLCQLVFEMLQELSPDQRRKMVYIVTSDTMVENPIVKRYMHRMSNAINIASAAQGLNVQAHIIYPDVRQSFWSLVIGLGYPTPEPPGFRWCIERLKINPSNAFTYNTIKKDGEVIILLGVRKSESAARARNITSHEI